jgi:pyruvate decarboxylase
MGNSRKLYLLLYQIIADGMFSSFCHEMSKHITVATTILTDPATAANEIDRVLTTMMHESRPVYIGVPADLSHRPISGIGLETPLQVVLTPDDESATREVVAEIRALLEKASKPTLIVDGCKYIYIAPCLCNLTSV